MARERLDTLERVLFRATRGNMFFQSKEIATQLRDPQTRELVDKSVFVVFFAGDRARAKVRRGRGHAGDASVGWDGPPGQLSSDGRRRVVSW